MRVCPRRNVTDQRYENPYGHVFSRRKKEKDLYKVFLAQGSLDVNEAEAALVAPIQIHTQQFRRWHSGTTAPNRFKSFIRPRGQRMYAVFLKHVSFVSQDVFVIPRLFRSRFLHSYVAQLTVAGIARGDHDSTVSEAESRRGSLSIKTVSLCVRILCLMILEFLALSV